MLATAAPAALHAQHTGHPPTGDSLDRSHDHAAAPLGIPTARRGSGTAWLPDATLHSGIHGTVAGWALMLHGAGYLQYVRTFGTRRTHQVGSVNWLMVAARREVSSGVLELRSMLSAEPLTLPNAGYPLPLQTARPSREGTLPDRQHPHELFSELAATYERAVRDGVAVQVYLALAGEPALGPVSYRHRPSAAADPVAPLGHHLQDVTHTSFGVLTAGAYTRRAKLEGSLFNGEHPDDVPTGIQLRGARLDSYAARLTVNPSERWSVSASYGFVAAARSDIEPVHAHGSLHRLGASVAHARVRAGCGSWTSTAVYGMNRPGGGDPATSSVLLESSLGLRDRGSIFGRAEYVQRTSEDLVLTGAIPARVEVAALSLGLLRELSRSAGHALGLGARATVNVVPPELEPFYGLRTPLGLVVFGRLHARGRCA